MEEALEEWVFQVTLRERQFIMQAAVEEEALEQEERVEMVAAEIPLVSLQQLMVQMVLVVVAVDQRIMEIMQAWVAKELLYSQFQLQVIQEIIQAHLQSQQVDQIQYLNLLGMARIPNKKT
jgi:hypothetical protein